MLKRMFIAAPTVALIAAVAVGCAGPSSQASDAVSAAIPPESDLTGTWYGTFSWIGAWHYVDEGKVALNITEDGTFTATVDRNGGTNNLAKPATWAGTVIIRGNRVTLDDSRGTWPTIELRRSRNNVLFGVANDPATESPVMMEFKRVSPSPSSPQG
jgi:hypothetical protein